MEDAGNSSRQNRFWNATDACCNFFESEVDDSGYIRSIIEEIQKIYNAPLEAHIFVGPLQWRVYVLQDGLRTFR